MFKKKTIYKNDAILTRLTVLYLGFFGFLNSPETQNTEETF